MKKFIFFTIGFALSHLSFTVKIVTGTMVVRNMCVAQNVTTYVDNISHKYIWYVTNSPSNYPGACKILGTVNSDTLFIKNQHVVFDTLHAKNNHIQNMQFIWCDGATGEMKVSRQDSLIKLLNSTLTFPASQVNTDWNSISGVSQLLNKPTTLSGYGINDAQSKLNGTGFVKTTGTTVSYDNSTYLTTVTASTGISITNNSVVTNTIPDRTVTITGTGLIVTSAYPAFTITPVARTSNTVTRSLVASTASSGFSISATQDYNVVYSVFAQASSALAGTNTSEVYLEISANNSTWVTIAGGSVVSVAGVLSTNGGVTCLVGFVPAAYYARIRTAATGSNAGSAIFTYKYGNENSY